MSDKADRTAWLQGNLAQCKVPAIPRAKPLRFVLLGAPGVGKGTQAELIGERLGTCHLSTGDIFRAAKCLSSEDRSPALDEALSYMHRGELVPDETVLNIVRERGRCLHCGGGFLLDGFPRTVTQAEALGELLKQEKIPLTAVLNYELPIEQIVSRISGRRTCPKCKAVYHVSARPPRVKGICDNCGEKIQQRDDDRPEAVRTRMEVYEQSTKPLTDYYAQRGLLVNVSAEGSPEEIFERTIETLKKQGFKVA